MNTVDFLNIFQFWTVRYNDCVLFLIKFMVITNAPSDTQRAFENTTIFSHFESWNCWLCFQWSTLLFFKFYFSPFGLWDAESSLFVVQYCCLCVYVCISIEWKFTNMYVCCSSIMFIFFSHSLCYRLYIFNTVWNWLKS